VRSIGNAITLLRDDAAGEHPAWGYQAISGSDRREEQIVREKKRRRYSSRRTHPLDLTCVRRLAIRMSLFSRWQGSGSQQESQQITHTF